MFAQRSIPGRVLDAVVGPIPGTTTVWSVRSTVRRVAPGPLRRPFALAGRLLPTDAARLDQHLAVGSVTAVLIPFVLVVQLLSVALLFALPTDISLVLILVPVVITEEIAKSIHVYAGYTHGRFSGSLRGAVGLGTASGIGFFLGEKIGLIAQLVGLQDIQEARTGLAGSVAPEQVPLLFALLLAPLALHVVTAVLSAVGARTSRQTYTLALVGAMVLHYGYNLTVVTAVGGI